MCVELLANLREVTYTISFHKASREGEFMCVSLRVCSSEGEKKRSHSMNLIKEGVKTASWSIERKTPHMWAASHR